VVGQQNADIADTLQLRDVATATIFWFSIYEVHNIATWRIPLNRPCAAAMRPMSNYFDHLFCLPNGLSGNSAVHIRDQTHRRSHCGCGGCPNIQNFGRGCSIPQLFGSST